MSVQCSLTRSFAEFMFDYLAMFFKKKKKKDKKKTEMATKANVFVFVK